MWTAGRTVKKIFKQPGAFALAVVKQFRANHGVLLAGAVAYYTLLSLVPLLILILMALSHIIPTRSLIVCRRACTVSRKRLNKPASQFPMRRCNFTRPLMTTRPFR